jgi:hypothetical protein
METSGDTKGESKQGDRDPLPIKQPAPAAAGAPAVNPPAPANQQSNALANPEQEQGRLHGAHDLQPHLSQLVGNKEPSRNNELSRFERQTIRLGWFGLGVSFLSLLAAFIAGIFVYQQWREMNAQTGYMNRESKRARIDSAEASISTAKQMQIAQKQADAAQKQVAAVTSQMREDQRPWIKLTERFTRENIRPGNSRLGEVTIQNIGKTPAVNVRGRWYISIVKNGEKPRFDFIHVEGNQASTGIIYPSDPASSFPSDWYDRLRSPSMAPPKRELTEDDMLSLFRGKSFIMMYGRFTYTDSFQIRHWTQFCAWTAATPIFPAPPSAEPYGNFTSGDCTAFNAVDHNY